MADFSAPPQFDTVVRQETFMPDALTILALLRPEWNATNVKSKFFTEGCINTLAGCFMDETPDDMIMFRIFQRGEDNVINRESELQNVKMLSDKGLAPRMLGIFKNGFCYKFAPGKCLTIDTILEEKNWRLVAKTFANFHSIRNESDSSIDAFDSFSFVKDRITDFPDSLLERVAAMLPEHAISKQNLLQDAELIQEAMKNLNAPVVFCHGDPTPLNMILSKSEDDVMFIDFEFSHFGYQGFDIAFHFCEFAGLEKPDFSRHPSQEFQLGWLRVYADLWFPKTIGRCATRDDVTLLLQQVNSFVPAVHFTAAVVTIAMGATMPILDFKYAVERFKEYFKTKAQLVEVVK